MSLPHNYLKILNLSVGFGPFETAEQWKNNRKEK